MGQAGLRGQTGFPNQVRPQPKDFSDKISKFEFRNRARRNHVNNSGVIQQNQIPQRIGEISRVNTGGQVVGEARNFPTLAECTKEKIKNTLSPRFRPAKEVCPDDQRVRKFSKHLILTFKFAPAIRAEGSSNIDFSEGFRVWTVKHGVSGNVD